MPIVENNRKRENYIKELNKLEQPGVETIRAVRTHVKLTNAVVDFPTASSLLAWAFLPF